ncbi:MULTISPECIES: glycosyltransferase [Sphingopyxis]|uniref:glycosyltransferase n=1 Tax=Sphingopyxis TaxID=165697 RepID=UPI0016444A70|nr:MULTISPECIES: glycosyltransferase [Sphingopyxis]QXF11818.1 glycosyltransferase [Sphingopyxis terrae subsp. terrae]
MVAERLPRILHLITGLDMGGAERSLANLLLGAAKRRHVPHVVSLSGEGHYGPILSGEGIGVDKLGLGSTPQSLAAIGRLRRIVRLFRPDGIQGWMYHGNLIASLAPWLAGRRIPVAWNIRQSLYDIESEKRVTRWVIRRLAGMSAGPAAIVYNSFQSRAHHEAFGFAAANGIVIPNGFDCNRWRPDAGRRATLRSALGLGSNELLLGFVGRFHPMKDIPTFLAACERAMADDPRLHVALVGEGLDLENPKLALALNGLPRGRVHALGRQRTVEAIMPAFDLFCLSSVSEAFPNVLGEAMATALPCIATDVGDCARLLDGNGILVPPGDASRIADAIREIAATSLARRREIGIAARERIVASYAMDATADAYANLFDMMMKRET